MPPDIGVSTGFSGKIGLLFLRLSLKKLFYHCPLQPSVSTLAKRGERIAETDQFELVDDRKL
jgi:hypothetical protein